MRNFFLLIPENFLIKFYNILLHLNTSHYKLLWCLCNKEDDFKQLNHFSNIRDGIGKKLFIHLPTCFKSIGDNT